MTTATKTSGRSVWIIRFVEKGTNEVRTIAARGDTASHAKQQVENRLAVQYIQNSRPAKNDDTQLLQASREQGIM